jgi:hypothetical protein
MSNHILSVIIATFSTICLARSQGKLSWQFDTTAFSVQPTDQILLTGTLSNSSDSPFVIQGGGARFTGDLQWHYQVSWLFDISGATVPADGTLQFDYCILTPIGGLCSPVSIRPTPSQILPPFSLGLMTSSTFSLRRTIFRLLLSQNLPSYVLEESDCFYYLHRA